MHIASDRALCHMALSWCVSPSEKKHVLSHRYGFIVNLYRTGDALVSRERAHLANLASAFFVR